MTRGQAKFTLSEEPVSARNRDGQAVPGRLTPGAANRRGPGDGRGGGGS